jgi:hypothetical protein
MRHFFDAIHKNRVMLRSAPQERVSKDAPAVLHRQDASSRYRRSKSLLHCTEFTRVLPQRPSPTIAARIIASPELSGYGGKRNTAGSPMGGLR